MKAGSASRPEFVKRAEHHHVKAALQVDNFSGFSSGEVRGKRREDCVGARKAFSDGVSPRLATLLRISFATQESRVQPFPSNQLELNHLDGRKGAFLHKSAVCQ